jgi:hypothetical protein
LIEFPFDVTSKLFRCLEINEMKSILNLEQIQFNSTVNPLMANVTDFSDDFLLVVVAKTFLDFVGIFRGTHQAMSFDILQS